MRMVGAVWEAALRIELALRGAQPAQADWYTWIVRAGKQNLLAVRVEKAKSEEDVGVGGVRRDEELGRARMED